LQTAEQFLLRVSSAQRGNSCDPVCTSISYFSNTAGDT